MKKNRNVLCEMAAYTMSSFSFEFSEEGIKIAWTRGHSNSTFAPNHEILNTVLKHVRNLVNILAIYFH